MSLDVTQRGTATCNAGSASLPAERETALNGAEILQPAMTDSDRRPFDTAAWVEKFRDHFTPPNVLLEQRPAVEAMRRYAERGRYAAAQGPARRAGIAWFRLVAAPTTVLARLGEWVAERPARFAVVAVTVKLLTFLPPVAWLVDHLIKPGADLALWLFL